MLPDGVLTVLKKNRHVYQLARTARMSFGSLVGASHVRGIPGRVHFNDFMLDSLRREDVERYAKSSYEVIALLEAALGAAKMTWPDVRSVLEFGCGYGRVTRALVQKVPAETVTVCDVIDEGARFCVDEFGVKSVPATVQIEDFSAEPADLLFFISVQTHLSEERLEALQRKLVDLLNPGGVCFFTTHGWPSAKHCEQYGGRWKRAKSAILAELNERGVSFHPYGYYKDPGYGMTWETYE